jgi:uncharacterized Zn finger protein (UPF0148 family)
MSGGPNQKQNMAATAELMIKGAALLREACPRCGGVQIKFQGRTYCTAQDDLEKALLGDSSKEETQPGKTEAKAPGPTTGQHDSLASMLEKKLSLASEQLEQTTDVEEQAKLLDLISKYVETLGKLRKTT